MKSVKTHHFLYNKNGGLPSKTNFYHRLFIKRYFWICRSNSKNPIFWVFRLITRCTRPQNVLMATCYYYAYQKLYQHSYTNCQQFESPMAPSNGMHKNTPSPDNGVASEWETVRPCKAHWKLHYYRNWKGWILMVLCSSSSAGELKFNYYWSDYN